MCCGELCEATILGLSTEECIHEMKLSADLKLINTEKYNVGYKTNTCSMGRHAMKYEGAHRWDVENDVQTLSGALERPYMQWIKEPS